jgi:hypothetical protein
MKNYFELLPNQQKTIITQTAAKLGLPEQAVEKDLWVTTVLQIVFTLPFADKLLFKGGTSLSKSYGLINRFSEDIDLAIDRSLFGYEGILTKKQIKQLRKQSSLFVINDFSQALTKAVELFNLQNFCTIVPEKNGEGDSTYPEPRKIDIVYKSLFNKNNYLQPKVMLEIGARSLFEPTELKQVNSLISSNFKQIETSVVMPDITTALPAKTFLEKSFLLHELFTTNRAANADRKSRHLYDLERMIDKEFAQKAINDDALWNEIAEHRKVFNSVSGVDYTPDIRKRICLVPPSFVIDEWRKDYQEMQNSMIYGNSLPFDELLERIKLLENRFRHTNC